MLQCSLVQYSNVSTLSLLLTTCCSRDKLLSRSTRSIFTADASNFNRHFFLAPFFPSLFSLYTRVCNTAIGFSSSLSLFSPHKKTQLYICAYPHLISTLLSPIRVATYSLIICHFLATRKLNPPPPQ